MTHTVTLSQLVERWAPVIETTAEERLIIAMLRRVPWGSLTIETQDGCPVLARISETVRFPSPAHVAGSRH